MPGIAEPQIFRRSRGFAPAAAGALLFALLAPWQRSVHAQTLVLVGKVTSDSSRTHAIDGAEVSIPALGLAAHANADGTYRLEGLRAGRYLVLVRAIGYAKVEDSVSVDSVAGTPRNFVLTYSAKALPAVVTNAKYGKQEYFSRRLQEFENRRAQGIGHFIAEEQLRQFDMGRLTDVIQNMPGLRMIGSSTGTYASSARKQGTAQCASTVYLDGVILYDARTTRSLTPPNLDAFNVDQLAGVEYYAGESTAPMGFRQSGCGLLLLWNRER
jgi:hypothetical protein